MNGKALRLKRFLPRRDSRIVIFPLDHGVTCGPIAGLERVEDAVLTGIRGGVDAFVLHKGMLGFLEAIPERLPGIFMHLSASTQVGPAVHYKITVGTVEEAVRRGADGVSVHVNLGDEHEPEMLRNLGFIGSACAEWQMPLLVMVYVRGAKIEHPVPDSAIAHAARLAAELGADIIKLPAPRDDAVLAEITSSLHIPVVVAGGGRIADSCQLLERIEKYLAAGARGVAAGRNIFQRQRPSEILRAICSVVHGGEPAREAWEKFCTPETG